MIVSSGASLLAAERKTVAVPCPELGDGTEVLVSVMSGRLRDKWTTELATHGKADFPRMRALLLAFSCVSECGSRLFSDSDVDAIQEMNGVISDRLYRAAFDVNRLAGDAVEDVAKN